LKKEVIQTPFSEFFYMRQASRRSQMAQSCCHFPFRLAATQLGS